MKPRWSGFHSPLARDIEAFLAHKRAAGRSYKSEEFQLRMLDAFLTERRIRRVASIDDGTLGAFLASRRRRTSRSFNSLVSVLERLFDWLVAQERLRRSPLRARHRRRGGPSRRPFILDRAAVQQLLAAAATLKDDSRNHCAPRRGSIYRAIFGILYALGLRVGELVRLRWQDVDFDRRVLTIHETKFGKSRFVPFGPRVEATLHAHREAEVRRGWHQPKWPVFSFGGRGRGIHVTTISSTFRRLRSKLGLVLPPGVAPPRLHDLRHSFAVGTLVRWYREGIDPSRRLLHLATFMGHVDANSTAVYLTLTPELLSEASSRFHEFAAPASLEVPS